MKHFKELSFNTRAEKIVGAHIFLSDLQIPLTLIIICSTWYPLL